MEIELEDASYFDIFSETTVGKVVEGEDRWPLAGESFRQSLQDDLLTIPLPTCLCCFLLAALMDWLCLRKEQGTREYRQRSHLGNPQTHITHTQTLSCKATMDL